MAWAVNLAGLLAFALILYLGGVRAWDQILKSDWLLMLAALAVTLIWNVVATYRWALIADRVTESPEGCPFRYYFTYHMLGMLLGQVAPITVGMLGGRPAALSLSRGVPLTRSALSVFLDKFFDLILALLLVLPTAFYLVGWISLAVSLGIMAAIVVVATLLISWRYEWAVRGLARFGARLALPLSHLPLVGKRLARRLPAQLERLTEVSVGANGLATKAFLVTLVMYALLAARLVFMAEAFRLSIPWYLLAMSVCVTQLTLIFSVTPGSLGFLEGGWAAVFSLGGVPLEQFTVFVIGRRFYFLIFTALITLLAFAWIRESPANLFRAVLSASRRPGAGSEPGGVERSEESPLRV
ncbi:MAG TPA: lysylphosphatidylglycerol synthase transmembrane domain-containing protein [Anaerolineae bacterium]|nr:lysylphosphatidylglycerol synthase transmembrane domain-containing protein [Anaerolineae bacterium]